MEYVNHTNTRKKGPKIGKLGNCVVVFEGEIIVVDTNDDADKAIEYLKQFRVVGFDSETRPAFKKGKSYKVALIQLATEEKCFLFRLNTIDFPQSLAVFLSDSTIKKIGLSLKDDFSAIRKRIAGFKPESFIELQTVVKNIGIKEAGLQKIYAILFDKKISKSQRLSNWEAQELSSAQKMYASIDAWACLRIYKRLITLNETEKHEL